MFVFASCFTAHARAQTVERDDLALLVGPLEPGVEARVRGQTADLGWTIEVVDDVDASASAAVRASRAARERGARLAIAIDASGSERALWIVERAPGGGMHAEERTIGGARGHLGASARIEAVAVIVRSLLVERAPAAAPDTADPTATAPTEAPPPDTTVHDATDDPSDTALSEAEPEATPTPAPTPAPASSPSLAFVGLVGAVIAIDGAAPLANLGPRARVGLAIEALELAIEASVAPDEPVTDADVATHLVRVDSLATIAYALALDPLVGLTLALGGGATIHARHTETAGRYQATPDAVLASFTGLAEARLTLRPLPALGVELAVGALVPADAPAFVVVRADGTELARHTLWPVQPRIALGVSVRLP